MGNKSMRLTERDLQILAFINQFGFCEMPHLDRQFQFNKPRNYQIIKRLIKGGLLQHQFVFHKKHGIYWLSKEGAKLTNLPPLKKLPLAIYQHEVMLIDVYTKLMNQHPEARWVSERELRYEKFIKGVGQFGHVADGKLIFPDNKVVAIELELTSKSNKRIERILKQYSRDTDIQEIWYFCADKVIPLLSKLAARMPFVKIRTLTELLDAKP